MLFAHFQSKQKIAQSPRSTMLLVHFQNPKFHKALALYDALRPFSKQTKNPTKRSPYDAHRPLSKRKIQQNPRPTMLFVRFQNKQKIPQIPRPKDSIRPLSNPPNPTKTSPYDALRPLSKPQIPQSPRPTMLLAHFQNKQKIPQIHRPKDAIHPLSKQTTKPTKPSHSTMLYAHFQQTKNPQNPLPTMLIPHFQKKPKKHTNPSP